MRSTITTGSSSAIAAASATATRKTISIRRRGTAGRLGPAGRANAPTASSHAARECSRPTRALGRVGQRAHLRAERVHSDWSPPTCADSDRTAPSSSFVSGSRGSMETCVVSDGSATSRISSSESRISSSAARPCSCTSPRRPRPWPPGGSGGDISSSERESASLRRSSSAGSSVSVVSSPASGFPGGGAVRAPRCRE